ncbi:conserved Plasmodium protein, unknown function [Plasmodium sp. gorilla clade G2]|uniref:conserved Plasmodium protein, unknown function n=1 Tax=Plasmodium sp. gorilla clade G2 TaxID=880535 RepID=UPI000D2170B6|nr:conserved Plasmodium protein, unknown function [Plasmodium sp. gorilla clade G2]SOV15561.1 conserved Plasmodium protein, unknown function [Plasmodium sp. gorilla clade G2]
MADTLVKFKGYKYGNQKIYPHFKNIRDYDVYKQNEYETDTNEISLYDYNDENIKEKNKLNDKFKRDNNDNKHSNNKHSNNKHNNNKHNNKYNNKYNNIYSNNYYNSYNHNDININSYLKKKKKRIYSKKKSLLPFEHIDNNIENDVNNSDNYLESFVIKKKTKNIPLNNKYIVENSNIELKNKLKHTLNPALSLMASRAVDGLLGGVHKHMQGPIAISSDGNNSPLANQIVTPNVYGSPNSISPINMTNNIAPLTSNPSPAPSPLTPPIGSSMSQAATTTNISGGTPIGIPNLMSQGIPGGIPTPPGVQIPNNAIPFNPMNPTNAMPLNQIGQNPAFNIHPTASNLRGDPGNVNYNEVVSITIGIVLSLVLFCFIFGCLTKLCKPKKRRR